MEGFGCQQTEELISDITNELMLQLGNNAEDHSQLLKQFNKLTEIKNKLIEWKFGLLSDHQNTLEYQAEAKRGQLNSLINQLNDHQEENKAELERIKKIVYHQTKLELYDKQTAELNKNYLYLNTVLESLKGIKKQVEAYHENLLKSNQIKRNFEAGLNDVYKVGERLARDFDIKADKVKQQNQIILKRIKQVQEETKIQQSKRTQSTSNLELRRHNSKIIEKQINYKVLEIEASNKKLGESCEEIVYKELTPNHNYKSQIGIYISVTILILLAHYVIW